MRFDFCVELDIKIIRSGEYFARSQNMTIGIDAIISEMLGFGKLESEKWDWQKYTRTLIQPPSHLPKPHKCHAHLETIHMQQRIIIACGSDLAITVELRTLFEQ